MDRQEVPDSQTLETNLQLPKGKGGWERGKLGVWGYQIHTTIYWRRKWQPTPVSLPGKSHGQRSLVGYHLWGRTESDTAERLNSLLHIKQVINKDLLYRAGDSAQCSVIVYVGKESEKE